MQLTYSPLPVGACELVNELGNAVTVRHPVTAEPKTGICRVCGCNQSDACWINHPGRPCAWSDDSKTICDHPYCLAKASCRVCGCTQSDACWIDHPGRPCAWSDDSKTICDHPYCLAKAESLVNKANSLLAAAAPDLLAALKEVDEIFSGRLTGATVMRIRGAIAKAGGL